jgi:hypothetical protein
VDGNLHHPSHDLILTVIVPAIARGLLAGAVKG